MENSFSNISQILATSKRIAHRLLAVGENRVELLLVEVQEERERLLRAILLALGLAAFGLLCGIALTLALVVLLWDRSPILALFTVALIYAVVAGGLYVKLKALQKDWHTLPATLEQLRKDRECLERTFD
ncbi:MAG: phage holin family protein [Verrucomicrobia bacterium]|nr:phage holin family protein [Verrucomicrobiota bacterium]